MNSFVTTEYLEGKDVKIEVYYTYYPFCKGRTDGRTGPKLEPDELEYIEIEEIRRFDGVGLSEADFDRLVSDDDLMEECWDNWELAQGER